MAARQHDPVGLIVFDEQTRQYRPATARSGSLQGLIHTIDAVNAGLDMSFEDAQDHEATLFGVLCSTADKKEGTSAFLEKRPAKFQGR